MAPSSMGGEKEEVGESVGEEVGEPERACIFFCAVARELNELARARKRAEPSRHSSSVC